MWRGAIGMLAGSCAVLLLPQWPPATWLAFGVAAVAMLGWWLRSTLLVTFAVGTAWCTTIAWSALGDRLAPELEGQVLRVRGTVVTVPQGNRDTLRFRFAPDPTSRPRVPRLLELAWYDAPVRVVAAERLELEVKLRRPRGFANPGGADNAARMLRDRIGASGYVRSGARLGADATIVSFPVLRIRALVAERINDALAGRASAGIVAGLAVGLQEALSREQWLELSRSGTSHLMAISGLHIAMVAVLAASLGQRLQRGRQRSGALRAQRDVATVLGLLAAFGYSLLAGWSVPTQRTLLLIALASLALVTRRRIGIANGLGACLWAVLLLDPLAPLAPGFWLSFGAVAAILYAASGLARPQHWLRGYLQVQLAVTLGLVPVLIGSFGAVSLVSAFVNLYAIPLYTLVIVPAVLASCAAALAWPAAGSVLLHATGSVIEWTWPLLAGPAHWSVATWNVAELPVVAWSVLLIGVVAVISPLPRIARLAGGALVVLTCASRPDPPASGNARITVLDVGQGLSVVVETRSHSLVFDAGPSFRNGGDTGQLVVAPFLRAGGIRRLDRLIVSHDDDDHSGGAASVLALMPTETLALGPSVKPASLRVRAGTTLDACRRGAGWTWDGVQFDWLHPGEGPYWKDNDSSCVLRIRAGAQQAWLTADIEAAAESEILQHWPRLGTADVLVAPHHGSRTSSSAAFVTALHPHWIVYSVGHRNRWNLPASSVVERWRAAGALEVRTSSSGAVTFELGADGGANVPVRWRPQHPRLWRDP